MSRIEGELAASMARESGLRDKNAHLRCKVDHLKAIARQQRAGTSYDERKVLVASTNRWSDDFQGCVE